MNGYDDIVTIKCYMLCAYFFYRSMIYHSSFLHFCYCFQSVLPDEFVLCLTIKVSPACLEFSTGGTLSSFLLGNQISEALGLSTQEGYGR